MFQRLQIGFHGGVVDAQEFVCRSHHVDTVGLALGTFLVHELVDRFIQRRILQIDAHDKEQRPPQGGCAILLMDLCLPVTSPESFGGASRPA